MARGVASVFSFSPFSLFWASSYAETGFTSPHVPYQLRSSSDNNFPSNNSVYVCQNHSWYQPCLLIPLYPEDNGQQGFWKAPADGGPGPFQTGNYTIGSWGPSPGTTTFWEDHHGNTSDLLTFPGTGAVDPYWADNVWTWYAYWDENDDVQRDG